MAVVTQDMVLSQFLSTPKGNYKLMPLPAPTEVTQVQLLFSLYKEYQLLNMLKFEMPQLTECSICVLNVLTC